jgi:hypothetical protein
MPTRPDAGQTGSAVVEFAMVLPLFLVVALALVQVGVLVRDRMMVEAAARAGARGKFQHVRRRTLSTLSVRRPS